MARPLRVMDALAATYKVTIKYRQMRNLRAAQILLGHTKIENTAKYFGVELDEALSFRSS